MSSKTSKLQTVARKVHSVLGKLQPFTASLAVVDRRAAALNAVILALQSALKKSTKENDNTCIELLTELSNAIAKVKVDMSSREKKGILRILARCTEILKEESPHEQADSSNHLQNTSHR